MRNEVDGMTLKLSLLKSTSSKKGIRWQQKSGGGRAGLSGHLPLAFLDGNGHGAVCLSSKQEQIRSRHSGRRGGALAIPYIPRGHQLGQEEKRRYDIMTKPHEFREVYIAIQNIPYHCESPQDLASDGVLAKGQLVWVQKMFDAEERSISISAFVDDVGILSGPSVVGGCEMYGW
jgi:hypothetical protein